MALSIGELVGYIGLDTTQAEKGLDGFQKSLKSPKLQKAALAGGALAGAALAAGMANAIQEDTAVRALKASLDPASDEAQKAGSAAGKLFAKGYGASIEEVTATTGAVITSIQGMRTASEDEIVAMTAKVSDLATAFEQDAGRAAQVAGQMITTGFAKDGTEALDLLTTGMQKVPKELRGDLLDAVDEYGPAFQQLGIGGENAMALLVKGSEKGMYGIDKTGDAIKEFGIRATDMSKATGGAYATLGLDQDKMTAALLKGGDEGAAAFQQIIGGLESVKDPVAQSQAALALFGTPLEDLNTSEIPGFISSLKGAEDGLGNFAGSSQRVTDELQNGPGAALQTFQNSMQTAFGDMMSYMLPVLQPILDLLVQFAPILGPLAAIIGLVSAAIMIWTGVQWLLNAALLANPITWIIVGVMLLIGALLLLIANWSAVVAWVTAVWGGFISWITGVINGFAGWWSGVWQGILDFFNGVWDSASSGVQGFIDGALQWFRDLPGNILSALGDLGSLLVDAGKNILQGFLDGLTSGFNAVKDFVGGIGSWIADNKGPKQYDLNLLVPAGGWIMDGLEEGIESSMPSLGGTLGDVSWMVANGIDPEVGIPTGNGVTAPVETGGHTFNVTIEKQDDPEATWKIFESRVNQKFKGQGLSLGG
ncbi:phage tail tape measure protein [Glutamicibacter mishrai]|uniref:phage tail tape measure protein n=1 Tax=Glutamicibacter mishrai TaxID=1775880 RepID=UPI0020CB7A17|nr:phage tail tape measure protein [Glutamicibacter mishrai]UTT40255.1 phage tail tape measure protein [Glutamicibacter mishrai]UTT40306.1 phage tail tape measure protein [Glutamicibacter mishrai]